MEEAGKKPGFVSRRAENQFTAVIPLADDARSQVSRVIRDAVKAEQIKRADPDSASRTHASYVPFWA